MTTQLGAFFGVWRALLKSEVYVPVIGENITIPQNQTVFSARTLCTERTLLHPGGFQVERGDVMGVVLPSDRPFIPLISVGMQGQILLYSPHTDYQTASLRRSDSQTRILSARMHLHAKSEFQ